MFTLSPSSSSSNYKIVIVINTLTTRNNQFEALNAPKIDLPFFFLHSYELNTTSLSSSLHIKLKKTKSLILYFLWFIESKKLMILSGSLSFEIMCSWRSLMCAKEICSSRRLIGKLSGYRRLTWKSFGQGRDNLQFSRPPDDLHVSRPRFYSEILVKPRKSWTTELK
ncbi:hypothetical protein IGI04_018649, partial [Brassica rapa subsp. trilocularis]